MFRRSQNHHKAHEFDPKGIVLAFCLLLGFAAAGMAHESQAHESQAQENQAQDNQAQQEQQEQQPADQGQEPAQQQGEETLSEIEQRLRQVEEKLGLDDENEQEKDEPAENELSDDASDEEAKADARTAEERADEERARKDERDAERSERRRNRYERRVSVGDRVRVRKGETVSEVVAAGGPVEIEGNVEGDVTSWGGDVTIDGSVGGDVKAYSADIELEDDADVLGSVISYGGEIDRDPEASVLGVVDERSFGATFGRDRDDLVFDDSREQRRRRSSRVVRWDRLFELAWLALGLSMLFLLAAFTLLVAPDPMARLRRTIDQELWKSGLVGLAVVISAIPVFFIVIVLLTVLLIGIPLIPVVVFLYMLAGFVAVVACAYALGRRLSNDDQSPYWSLAIGSFLLVFPLLAGEALGFLSFLDPLAILMKVIGWMLLFAAGTIGIGALMLTSFGTRFSSMGGGSRGFVPPPPPPRSRSEGTTGRSIIEEESGPLDAILEVASRPVPDSGEVAEVHDEVESELKEEQEHQSEPDVADPDPDEDDRPPS